MIGGAFCLIGAGLSVVAGWHLTGRLAFIRSSAVTSGMIVALSEVRDGMEAQRFRYPRVRFRTASGRDITFESSMGRGGDTWKIGDAVSVRYQLDHPEAAEFDSVLALWGATLLFGALAMVFLGVGAGLLFGLIPV